ncbi:MAG: hypothetical protein J2O39_00510 [Acidimicrobiales bacterium]|nr:hypothetical protein [Acidimicrobiales bacterium]
MVFRPEEPGEVLALMARLEEDGGWLNLSPVPDEETAAPRRQWLPHLFDLLLDAGPDVPVCTWVPANGATGKRSSRGAPTTSIGVQHPSGQRAIERLRQAGIDPPGGWRVDQDHPRRGLVLSAPAGGDHRVTLEWLVRAGEFLSLGPPARSWVATAHRRR